MVALHAGRVVDNSLVQAVSSVTAVKPGGSRR
jgi:hypothetical protein